jgi:hypothetical protein
MKNYLAGLRAAAACGTLTLLSMSAMAQTPAPSEDTTVAPPAAQLPDSAAPAVEEKKIDQFADAYIAVQEIQVRATQQLSATTDTAKANEVKQTAEDQMIQAVQRTGLQIEEFNQIVQAMATDEVLREKVSGRIGERKRTS